MNPQGNFAADVIGNLQHQQHHVGEIERGSDHAVGDLAFLNAQNIPMLSNHAAVPRENEGHESTKENHKRADAHIPATNGHHVVQVRTEDFKQIPELQIIDVETDRSIAVKPGKKDATENKKELPPVPIMALWRYR
jgi:hypothetical protein